MYHHRDPTTTVSIVLAQEQLETSCETDCTSCESGDGGRHACATVWSMTVEIAGSSGVTHAQYEVGQVDTCWETRERVDERAKIAGGD